MNDNYKISEENTYEVPCKVFSDIDTGDIDLLSVNIEGAEWYVLKNMRSQPKVLSIETHGKFYQNPFMAEIQNWIRINHYVIWYKDNSDTVFVKEDLFPLNLGDKIELALTDTYIAWRKFKKHLYFWK